LVERSVVPADQGFQISCRELVEQRVVPTEVGLRVTFGAREMRHAAAGNDRGPQTHGGDDPRDRLAKGVTALHRRLRRQISIDVDRQHRVLDVQMGERYSHRVVDLCGAAEGWVEALPVEFPNQRETDFARNLPVEASASKLALGYVPDMDREGRGGLMEKLLRVVVRKNDPKIGRQGLQRGADLRSDRADPLDRISVLGLGHGKELRGMRQHRPADHSRIDGSDLCHRLQTLVSRS